MEYLEFLIGLFKGEADRKKVLAVIFTIIITAFALMFYEGITATFTLNRLQKSADLVSKLQEIESAMKTNSNPILIASYKQIQKQAIATIGFSPLPIEFSSYLGEMAGKDFGLKFLAGSAVFWFLGGIAIWRHLIITPFGKASHGFWNLAKSTVQFGCFYGFFAIWVPKVFWLHWWPLFHIFIYPILATISFAVIASVFIKPETDLATNEQAEKKCE